MPITTGDRAKITQMIAAKQALEVSLALDLLEIFNDPGARLIQQVRALVKLSVAEMSAIRSLNEGFFLSKWSGNWNNYACCTDNGITVWDPDKIIRSVDNFKAEHCADWIRIFGELIEESAKVGVKDMSVEESKRTGYQTGGAKHWKKMTVEKSGSAIENPDAWRRRDKSFSDRDSSGKTYWDRQTESWRLMSGHHDKRLGIDSKLNRAGLGAWKVMDGDTCGTMDRIFGLCPGATISGTTTDNIYFFDKFGNVGLDPIYQLLPTATIVGGGHHTLLEVALPLSLRGIIKYKVGLYSTLFPVRAQAKIKCQDAPPEGAKEIQSLLMKYENHHDNHCMLIAHLNGEVQQCIKYFHSVGEREAWGRLAIADESLMNSVHRMKIWPDRNDVLNFIRERS